jgi:hypothetical protein
MHSAVNVCRGLGFLIIFGRLGLKFRFAAWARDYPTTCPKLARNYLCQCAWTLCHHRKPELNAQQLMSTTQQGGLEAKIELMHIKIIIG